MRKIEEAMNRAINSGRNWHGDNTAVIHADDTHMEVTLHGNRIAQRVHINGTTKWYISLAGWNTSTTKSRLNAILREQLGPRYTLYTKRGTVFLTDAAGTTELSADGWQHVREL